MRRWRGAAEETKGWVSESGVWVREVVCGDIEAKRGAEVGAQELRKRESDQEEEWWSTWSPRQVRPTSIGRELCARTNVGGEEGERESRSGKEGAK